jgi:hypothetical protein
MKDMQRRIRFQNKYLTVVRLYSSGLGEQFSVIEKKPDGQVHTTYLSEDAVRKSPDLNPLFEICKDSFENRTVLNGPGNWQELNQANTWTIPPRNPVRK